MENDGQLLVTDNNYDLIRGNPENCIILENCFAKRANGWNSIMLVLLIMLMIIFHGDCDDQD